MKGDRERCLAAGMDGYVAKPIQAADLLRALAEHTAPPPTRDPPEEPIFDYAVALDRLVRLCQLRWTGV
jgi:hypothetical protein